MKKKVVISVIAAVLVVGITVGVIIAVKPKEKDKPTTKQVAETQSQTVQIDNVSDTDSKEDNGLKIEDDGTGLKPDESVVSEVQNNTGVKAETPAKAKQPEKAEDAAQPVAPSNNNDYVQMADPNTGISYDGKSPIIYTYEDGSKGTEKKKGASYEVIPGLIRYYYPPDEVPWDGTCSHCGKVAGDGLNGTCVRWLMGDMTCPNCGTFVKNGECHTCK